MDTLKINVSLPAAMYQQARMLVDRGIYHSFSEIVRSGLRNELDEQKQINPEFAESIRKAEKSGYKEFKNARQMLKNLHSAAD